MYDAVVIGSGYGGLAAALELARADKRVLLCEALNYPGGCASTFSRKGYQFEAGATLFSGFASGQLFDKWIERHDLDVTFESIDPPILFRTPDHELPISSDRAKTLASFCELPDAPVSSLRAFFARQKRVADTLWPIFDEPSRLPPFSMEALWWHLKRSWRYPGLLSLVNRPLISVLRAHSLEQYAPFVQYCNALSQITIQTNVMEAEAPFALSTLDYPYRGTGHIHGGIGRLGQAMLDAIERCGGEVWMSSRVKSCRRIPEGWEVETRKGNVKARTIVANMLPQAVDSLCSEEASLSMKRLKGAVEEGWGAVMLYLVIEDHQGLARHPHHIQTIVDPTQPLMLGNHLFCSISGADEEGRAPEGQRTVTVSTHIPLRQLREMEDEAQADWVQSIQERMREGLRACVPEVGAHIRVEVPASPRTFERFTRRPFGYVGGIPRTRGLHNYRGLFPTPYTKDLWLVGDSVFPGQSTLATAVGGVRTARAVLSRL